MKTLGLIGGTTWLSTAEYYKLINQLTNERLGGLSSAKMLLYSLNLDDFKPASDPNKWRNAAGTLSTIAQRLEEAGADCLVICANTPHMVADIIQERIHIPLIHIAEVTAKEIRNHNMKKVGLLGTKSTMEFPFFKDKLSQHQIETLIPGARDREFIHNAIFTELGMEIFSSDTRAKCMGIIQMLVEEGSEGIILGCTELPFLIRQEECPVPLFNTTQIHAKAAVEFALGD